MRYPPSFLDRLRGHARLSELIGRRVALRKAGREFSACCPFHQEKSPSFTVNDEKGFYHCFGCGAHGDAIGFVAQYERLDYREAIESLARELGVPLPELTPEVRRQAEREKTYHDVAEAARGWFVQQLHGPQGAAARAYLAMRGLTPETQARFSLGYAPDARDGLRAHLLKAGFPEPLLLEAGLLIRPDQGNSYDRFRGRVMFPIRDSWGKMVAFGGRLLVDDKEKKAPKYLNSPETALFKKGELLFNLDQARKPARAGGQVLVMEGYMDVIACVQAGVEQCVATLGTAVTPAHLGLLWGLADEPALCLDGDAAGQRAMLRAAEVALPLLTPGKGLRFVALPKGDDPDSLVKRDGKDALLARARGGMPLSDALWQTHSAGADLTRPEGRSALEAKLMQLANAIRDATTAGHFKKAFRDKLWQASRPQTARPQTARPEFKPKPGGKSPRLPVKPEHPAALPTQHSPTRALFALLLRCPGLLHHAEVEDTLSTLELTTPELHHLRDRLATLPHDFAEADWPAWLEAQSFTKLAAQLAQEHHLTLRRLDDEEAHLICWRETCQAHHLAQLETDAREAQQRMGDDEAAYARWEALQEEIKELRKRLARGTGDEAE